MRECATIAAEVARLEATIERRGPAAIEAYVDVLIDILDLSYARQVGRGTTLECAHAEIWAFMHATLAQRREAALKAIAL